MKLFLLLLMSFAASAQVIFPRIVTFPNQVQLTINNYTQKDQRCSGSIFIYHMSGRFESRFYSNTIYKGMSDFRTYPNFNYQDPFRNAHHSVNCYPY
jgi:hypothetical protein